MAETQLIASVLSTFEKTRLIASLQRSFHRYIRQPQYIFRTGDYWGINHFTINGKHTNSSGTIGSELFHNVISFPDFILGWGKYFVNDIDLTRINHLSLIHISEPT